MHIPQPKAGYMAAIFTCPVNTKETALQPGERPYMVRSLRHGTKAPLLSISCATAALASLPYWAPLSRT